MKKKILLVFGVIITILACNLPQATTPTPNPGRSITFEPTATFQPTSTPVVVTKAITPTATLAIVPKREVGYTVKAGDTLTTISLEFGVPAEYIATKNNLDNPDMIFEGQTLIIPIWPAPTPEAQTNSDKEIVVVISTQTTCAYEKGEPVKCVLVSTGLPGDTETPRGKFSVYAKLPSTDMKGPGYYLKDVPWNLCFLQRGTGYCIHGTYWHSNFGQKMSHGCVNLETGDAEWFYNWAEVGTPVTVID